MSTPHAAHVADLEMPLWERRVHSSFNRWHKIGAAMLIVVGWTGGKYTSTSSRLDRVEIFMERSAPILESLGRGLCLDNPPRAQRDGLPCEKLLGGAGYLTHQAARAPRDATARVARYGAP